MEDLFDSILASPLRSAAGETTIGHSRLGRPIRALCIGGGPFRISLIGGCHADEPAGPMLLRHLVSFLGGFSPNHPLLREFQWWIVPHVNPDGEERNRSWQSGVKEEVDLVRYLRGVCREPPGDDLEFGFPRHPGDGGARPENRGLVDWWGEAPGPFDLHLSLHGMAFAGGAWFLIEPAWENRCEVLKQRCRAAAGRLGYPLHDAQRRGEKGFHRLERGFCTRPDSEAMAGHFRALGDPETAARFRPSSMETIRAMGGDPLTLVPEMPLFLLPGVGEDPGPPDPEDVRWKERIQGWREALASREGSVQEIRREAAGLGLRAMLLEHQMRLQWALLAAGVEQVVLHRRGPARSPAGGGSSRD